jgi:RimJ/RimL family protein N-acetyltransferase
MNTAPTTYAIRINGHLDDHWSAWLGDLDMTRDDDGTTTVTISTADQAQLHGVLAGLRDIGAVITELRTTDAPVPTLRSVLERPLHTERLTLRPATADDADPTWKYRQPESVNEWLPGCPADLDGHRKLFSEPARLATTVIVTVGHHPTAPIIGDFMLRSEDAWARLDVADQAQNTQAELGWVLDTAHIGQDYATEAVRELLRYCFEDLGVRRITANCFLDNDTSWSLMERVGMRRELHAVRESLHRSGRWLDTVGYAILKDEWSPISLPRSLPLRRQRDGHCTIGADVPTPAYSRPAAAQARPFVEIADRVARSHECGARATLQAEASPRRANSSPIRAPTTWSAEAGRSITFSSAMRPCSSKVSLSMPSTSRPSTSVANSRKATRASLSSTWWT